MSRVPPARLLHVYPCKISNVRASLRDAMHCIYFARRSLRYMAILCVVVANLTLWSCNYIQYMGSLQLQAYMYYFPTILFGAQNV